jgi:hypothetical protein
MARGNGKDATERTIVLGLAALIGLILVLTAVFGPMRDDSDPQPTTYNAGSRGIKAAYELAGALGYDAKRWDDAPADLKNVDASRTTLVLTEPILPVKSLKRTQDEIAEFLRRGGRVVATGATGAMLLPNGKTQISASFSKGLCYAKPEGPGTLAAAGKVAMAVPVRWAANGPEFHVEERCGNEAVVVRYPYGRGEAVWWSSPMPLTNAGLNAGSDTGSGDDASLTLTLASLGPVQAVGGRRTVLFDEYLHEERESLDDLLSGLPWGALGWQSLAAAGLLVLSFGRKRGPLREPAAVPRTSPLEFADSMGRLYERAGATEAPLAAARARTMRFLAEECGLSHEMLRQTPEAIAETLAARIGGDWTALAAHLEAATSMGERARTGKLALKLVQALEEDRKALAEQVSSARRVAEDRVETADTRS